MNDEAGTKLDVSTDDASATDESTAPVDVAEANQDSTATSATPATPAPSTPTTAGPVAAPESTRPRGPKKPQGILSDMRLADVATLLNAYMGIIAIAAAFMGEVALAWHLVFFAIIIDGVDEFIARLGGGGGPLGSILDTMADVVTFVAAPAVIVVATFGLTGWSLAVALVFVTAGLLRLARFQNDEAPHFWGLSTPGAALFMGSAILIWDPSNLQLLIVGFIAADAMISRRAMPKLRGKLGLAGVAIILTNAILFMAAPTLAIYGLWMQLAFTVIYIAGGPMYVRRVASS